MKESEMFRKAYHLGRIIWVRGEDRERVDEKLKDLWSFGNIAESRVWRMTPRQFIDRVRGGLDRMSMERFEALLVRGFEGMTHGLAHEFFLALKLFRGFQTGAGMRLILVTTKEIPFEILRIVEWMPVVIEAGGSAKDPAELDARVHSLIELASSVSEVPIRRLTERAAHFLEESVFTCDGDEILLLLVEGMRRSQGRVLRLRDILPNFSRYFGSDDEVKTYCN